MILYHIHQQISTTRFIFPYVLENLIDFVASENQSGINIQTAIIKLKSECYVSNRAAILKVYSKFFIILFFSASSHLLPIFNELPFFIHLILLSILTSASTNSINEWMFIFTARSQLLRRNFFISLGLKTKIKISKIF